MSNFNTVSSHPRWTQGRSHDCRTRRQRRLWSVRPCFAAVQHEVACSRPSDFRRALSHPPHCNTPAPSTTPVDLGPLHHLGACHLVWLGRRAPRAACVASSAPGSSMVRRTWSHGSHGLRSGEPCRTRHFCCAPFWPSAGNAWSCSPRLRIQGGARCCCCVLRFTFPRLGGRSAQKVTQQLTEVYLGFFSPGSPLRTTTFL